MKFKLLLALVLPFISYSSFAQLRLFGGIEGNYYQFTSSNKMDSLKYNQDATIVNRYGAGINAGLFVTKNLSLGVGYRRGGYKTSLNYNYSSPAYLEKAEKSHRFLAFGRYQVLKGKFGFVSDLQFSYSYTKEVTSNLNAYGSMFKEKEFTVAYIPRVIFYPVKNLSFDLALFQVCYTHTTRIVKDLSREKSASYLLNYTNGPTLGIHYYFNVGSGE